MNHKNLNSAKKQEHLAQNQKLPSAQGPCVSDVDKSHYLLQFSDTDIAAARMLSLNDGWRKTGWVEKDEVSV